MPALTRACAPADLATSGSVACWQQQLVLEAYEAWIYRGPSLLVQPEPVACYNWGAASFRAPGPDPTYFAYHDPEVAIAPCSAIFALSVLDRVDAPLRFLRGQAERLLPGGLLVCTFAAWDACGPDCAIGHELRARIYDRHSWRKLLREARTLFQLEPFGGVDLRYRGHTLGDHTLATLVATKRR